MYEHLRTLVVSILVGSLILAIGLGFFIAKLIVKPLHQAIEVLESVAAGDLTRVLEVDTTDEVVRWQSR